MLFAGLAYGMVWLMIEVAILATRSELLSASYVLGSTTIPTYTIFFPLVAMSCLVGAWGVQKVRRIKDDDPARVATAMFVPLTLIGLGTYMVNQAFLPGFTSPLSLAFDAVMLGVVGVVTFVLAQLVLVPDRWVALRQKATTPRLALVFTICLVAMVVHSRSGSAVGGATAPPARSVAPRQDLPHVVFMVIDTLRADHLGSYGYHRPTSPNLDKLATQGTRFTNFVAQSAWTRPSTASIFTGLYPSQHKTVSIFDRIPDTIVTLPQVMQRMGYRTGGFSANVDVSKAFGFARGFETYFSSGRGRERATVVGMVRARMKLLKRFSGIREAIPWLEPPALREDADLTDEALAWLDRQGEDKVFLYLHYFAPHAPYSPPLPYRDLFKEDDSKSYPNNYPTPDLKVHYTVPYESVSDENLATMIALYDGEIAYVDSIVQRVIDDLKRRGMWDNTLLVVTSDHGEEFYEHEKWGHGLSLYDEMVHVPLIVREPGDANAGRIVDQPLSHVDLMPTLLDYLGGPALPPGNPGRAVPLRAASATIDNREEVYLELYRELFTLRSLRTETMKFVYASVIPVDREKEAVVDYFAYDLIGDPGEDAPLDLDEQTIDILIQRLESYDDVESKHEKQGSDHDQDTIDQLKALGYIQ